jgi:hypothetical protein
MAGVLGILKGSGQALQALRSLLTSGVPAIDALAQVRSLGYTLIPQTAEQFTNYLTQVVTPADKALSVLSPGILPNIASIPLSLTKTLRNFSYLVKVTGRNPVTQQLSDQFISISTNSLLTKEQAIDAAQSMIGSSDRYNGMVSGDGEVTSISQNAAGLTNIDTIVPSFSIYDPEAPVGSIASLNANRNYLKTVASGPVSPIVFTQPQSYAPPGYDSLEDYYRDISQ